MRGLWLLQRQETIAAEVWGGSGVKHGKAQHGDHRGCLDTIPVFYPTIQNTHRKTREYIFFIGSTPFTTAAPQTQRSHTHSTTTTTCTLEITAGLTHGLRCISRTLVDRRPSLESPLDRRESSGRCRIRSLGKLPHAADPALNILILDDTALWRRFQWAEL